MTADPTAAELVERLRGTSGEDRAELIRGRDDAADLIEQQAGLLAAAQAKIAQAPHAFGCRENRAWTNQYCTCWKSVSPMSTLDAVREDAWNGGAITAHNAPTSDRLIDTLARNPYRAAQTGATDAQQ